jgi:hypothetical protein
MTSPKPAIIGGARAFEGRCEVCAPPIMARWNDLTTGEPEKEEIGSLVLRFSCVMTSRKPAMIGAARAFEGRCDACAPPIMARLG